MKLSAAYVGSSGNPIERPTLIALRQSAIDVPRLAFARCGKGCPLQLRRRVGSYSP